MRNTLFIFFILFLSPRAYTVSDSETKKSYIEDIFIWRISDELKLTATEEKKFTAIHKSLNRQKADLNKEIQETTQALAQPTEAEIKKLRKHIKDYNQLSLKEFDLMRSLLGLNKFASYLQIKSELTNKVKSIMSGEKPIDKDKKDTAEGRLPPPQVIIEK